MSANSKIEWCSDSWNPLRGQNARHTCARISPGCDNCYAATMTRRGLSGTAAIDYGRGETPNDPSRLDEKALMQPLRWKKPRTIFVCSMTDIAGAWVPDAWLDAIWAVMALAPQHDYQVLTKRPARLLAWFRSDPYERVLEYANRQRRLNCWPATSTLGIPDPATAPYRRVWIGVSIESDAYVWRANILRQIPASVRWISAEPLLSGLPSLNLTGIDWLVAGGESGPGARPMHPQWARDLRDRCQENGTAFFHKQNGAWTPERSGQIQITRNRWRYETQTFTPDGVHYESTKPDMLLLPGMTTLYRKGKHLTGRLLDGREWNEYPLAASAPPPTDDAGAEDGARP